MLAVCGLITSTILLRVEPVKSRRAEYAELTRAALLDAAADSFAAKGYAASSIVAIAATARVTKGALYHYFPNKRSLFEAVLERYQTAAQDKVLTAAAEHLEDPWTGALAALSATLDTCADPVAGKLIYIEAPIALGWQRFRESEADYTYANVRVLLQRLIEADVYPDDLIADATAVLVTGMITQAGVRLAGASARQRKRLRADLDSAIRRLMVGLRKS